MLIYKLIAIIYKTYDDKGIDDPHFRAIITILFLLFIHIVCVGLIFNLPSEYIMPWSSNEKLGIQYIKATIFFVLPLCLFLFIFRKKKLDQIQVTVNQINTARRVLPFYIFLSILLLFVLLIRHGIRKGTINF
jgi:hypothetical protein